MTFASVNPPIYLLLASSGILALTGCRQRQALHHEVPEIHEEAARDYVFLSWVSLSLRPVDAITSESIDGIKATYLEPQKPKIVGSFDANPNITITKDGSVIASWTMLGEGTGQLLLEADGYLPLYVTPQESEIHLIEGDRSSITHGLQIRAVKLRRSEAASKSSESK